MMHVYGQLSGTLTSVGRLQGALVGDHHKITGSLTIPNTPGLEVYTGAYEVTPKAWEEQILQTDGKLMADDVTTSGIQSGSSYAQYAIGHTAESPYSSTSNMYASSGSTGYAQYSFDFSDIPSNATIESIEVRCHGHRESNTISSTYVSQCALYRDGTAISEEVDFPSTSASIITLTPTTMPTRAQLDDVVVRHFVGYYGGLVTGISFEVTYSTGSGLDHYTYTYTVTGDATIAVVIGSQAQPKLYCKIGGTWTAVTAYKKVSGAWVLQPDATSVFQTGINYKNGE